MVNVLVWLLNECPNFSMFTCSLTQKQTWKQLHAAAFVLKDYLDPQTLGRFLQEHHFSAPPPVAVGELDISGGEDRELGAECDSHPSTVETFRIAAAARSFLTTVLLAPLRAPSASCSSSSGSQQQQGRSGGGGAQWSSVSPGAYLAPAPTISLIEKQFYMFVSAIAPEQAPGGVPRMPPRMAWDDVSATVQCMGVCVHWCLCALVSVCMGVCVSVVYHHTDIVLIVCVNVIVDVCMSHLADHLISSIQLCFCLSPGRGVHSDRVCVVLAACLHR
jgi:hypothetical protein